MKGCTLAARSQLAQARVLAQSFKHFHPEDSFSIVVVDGFDAPECTGGEIEYLQLSDIGMEAAILRRLPMLYDVFGVVAIVIPSLLRTLCRVHGADTVLYIQVEAEIFGSLHEVEDKAAEYGVALTPPYSKPPVASPHRRQQPVPYTADLVCVNTRGDEFLDWWCRAQIDTHDVARLADSPSPHEQRPFLPPAKYRHYLLDDPALNASYRNLVAARFASLDGRYAINGLPLKLFNFSGYDPDKPHLLSMHQGDNPRVLLSENVALARLCDEYRQRLLVAGYAEAKVQRCPFCELSTGLKLDRHALAAYRDSLAACEAGTAPEPPSPFFGIEDEKLFVQWLNESLRDAPPAVTRYMLAIHSARRDLQDAFPDPAGIDAISFHDWFLEYGRYEESVDERLVSSGGKWINQPEPVVTVAGYFRAELGIGEAARALVSALEAGKIPCHLVSYGETLNRQEHPFVEGVAPKNYTDINVICVNADRLPSFVDSAGAEFKGGRYSIGVWFWEVEDFPPTQRGAFHYVDEIWVASEFVRDTFMKISPKRVFKFPLPIIRPEVDLSMCRSDLAIPNGFVFLFTFDFFSVFERKNPLAIVNAFKRAFSPGEGAVLVIKTINGDHRIPNLERLKLAAATHPDIKVIDGYVSPIKKHTMTALSDCYVSLHRSEGFGLTMAEAMVLGKPVIATGYSGNLEFMTPENSYLCDYRLREVGLDAEPYPATAHWAEPDIEHAGQLMRHIFEDRRESHGRGARAAEDMVRFHSADAAGIQIGKRFAAIRAKRARASTGKEIDLVEDRIEALEASQRQLLTSLVSEVESPPDIHDAARLRHLLRQCYEQLQTYRKCLESLSQKLETNSSNKTSVTSHDAAGAQRGL